LVGARSNGAGIQLNPSATQISHENDDQPTMLKRSPRQQKANWQSTNLRRKTKLRVVGAGDDGNVTQHFEAAMRSVVSTMFAEQQRCRAFVTNKPHQLFS
jgi:hypothetical protein